VATTSVASKKQIEREAEATAEPEIPTEPVVEPLPQQADASRTGDQDWEDADYVEKQSLQQLVDRLHDKGEKEVSRIVKVSYSLGLSNDSLSSTRNAWPELCLRLTFPAPLGRLSSGRLRLHPRLLVHPLQLSPRTSTSCASTLPIMSSSDSGSRLLGSKSA
jgi:hypothetical protein